MTPPVGSVELSQTPPAQARPLRAVGIGAAIVVTYLAAARLGFTLAFEAEQVTTVWAPTGIALAGLLLCGVRMWPAVWLGAFLANATTSAPLWTAFPIATGNTLEAVAAVWVLRRSSGFDVSLGRLADVLRFLLLAALLCTAISATIGVTTLSAAGVHPWNRFSDLWLEWWFGDVLGAILVAPAILTVARHDWSRDRTLQAVLFVAASVLVTHIVFGQHLGFSAHPLEYAIFPVVITAAATGGPAVTSLAALSASVVAIWHTVHGVGPFAGEDLHDSLILLQLFMGVLAATSLLLGAAIAERLASERRERNAATMLRLAQRAGGVATFEWDFANQRARCSSEFFHIFGLPPEDGTMTGAEWGGFVHPEDREAMAAHLARALDGSEPAVADYRIVRRDGTTRWLTYSGQVQRTPAGPRMLGTVVDITDRKHLEDELRHHATELARRVREQQTLLDVLPIGIGIATDPQCRHIKTNRAFAQTLGLSPADNASKTAPAGERPTNFRVLTPDGLEVPDDQLPLQVAARERRDVREIELDIVHDDGRIVRLLEYAAPLVDDRGEPHGAVGAFVDVTAAHHARVTLARSEERYRHIFEAAGVSLWEEDFTLVKAALDELRQNGVGNLKEHLANHPEFVNRCVSLVKVVDVNEATLRLFAASDKAQLLESLDRIFRPETREVFAGELSALARGLRHHEAETSVQTLDGRPLHVVVSIAFPAAGEPLERVLVSITDITARRRAELALRQEVEVRTTLAQVGATLAGELRSDKVIEAVTDASTKLTGAEFGAFFYNVTGESGDAYQLYALSGAPREAFAQFPHPRATEIFGPTFRGEAVIRLDDVTQDSRYGKNSPFHGMPSGHLPVRSYLAVPVVGRGGEVLGGLFFGHSQPGVFSERHELLATGVAGWAAIALDNARLYQEAAEANRLKDEFLATLSHELRTPLNAVLGWAHMLREGTMHDSMRQRALESVERNARAQAQLVDDLLDVSRIIAGRLQIKSEAVDLAAVVANAVETVRAGVDAKRLHLVVDVPADRRILVTGDAGRLQQVVWNLVSNAVKFTPPGGTVQVEVSRVISKARIVVRDTGPGIDPAFRPHLFQRFRQMDASKTRVHGGLGLGLSIVRHLVEAHGGTVSAESAGIDQGATFRVELPLRAVDSLRPEQPASRGGTVDRILEGVRALIVDDEADGRELTRDVLESRGAVAETAASAGEALHLLSARTYDVLIADIGMPEQDGFALMRAIRSLPAHSPNRGIPAIALTAYTGPREREEALAAGFDVHLAKPVEPDRLIATVMARRQSSV